MTRTWTKIPERGSFQVMRFGLFLLNLCGYRLGLCFGFLATCYYMLTGRESRLASRAYLRRLSTFHPNAPKPSWLNVFRHHWTFAINIIDRMWFWQGRLDHYHFTSKGREHLLKRDSGVLLVGSHMGSFDALRAFSMDKKLTVNVVMYRANAENFNKLLKLLNPEADISVIELESGSIDQVFTLKEKLAAGEVVALLADRPAPHGRPRNTPLPFLGKEAPFPQNPWILASLLECPVLTVSGMRLGPRRYHVEVTPLADQVVLPRATRQAALREYMEVYAHRLQELCLAHPFQWFNFYDFWGEHAVQ